MKVIYKYRKNNKYFSIISYKRSWKEHGIKPRINFFTNKGFFKSCLDITLIIGYIIINYTLYDRKAK